MLSTGRDLDNESKCWQQSRLEFVRYAGREIIREILTPYVKIQELHRIFLLNLEETPELNYSHGKVVAREGSGSRLMFNSHHGLYLRIGFQLYTSFVLKHKYAKCQTYLNHLRSFYLRETLYMFVFMSFALAWTWDPNALDVSSFTSPRCWVFKGGTRWLVSSWVSQCQHEGCRHFILQTQKLKFQFKLHCPNWINTE